MTTSARIAGAPSISTGRRGVHLGVRLCGAAVLAVMAGAPARAQQAEEAGQGGGIMELGTINVYGASRSATGPVGGYVAPSTATGTKTNTPILSTPQSVSVISREQMEAQGVQTVAQALRYEAGVVSETRPGGRYDTVYIRGFGGFGGNANYVQYWDNLRFPKGINYGVASIDPYLLERIEILRGPASVLYGQTNPGGLVNLVSKRPTAAPVREVFIRAGEHGRIEGGFDVGGATDPEGRFLYRIVGLGRAAGTQVDYTREERFFIAPSFTWRPTEDTTITVLALYQRDPQSYYPNWMPALGTLQRNPNGQIPYGFFSGNPAFNQYDRTQASIGYQLEHRFNEVWTVRQNARYVHVDSEFKALSVPPGGSPWAAPGLCGGIANLCLARSSTHFIENLDSAQIDNQAEATVSTGPLEHKVLFGLDYQWQAANARSGNGGTTYVNYLAPVYDPVTGPALTSYQQQMRRQLGLYAQDQIRLGNWRAVFGLRQDWTSINTATTNLNTGVRSQAYTSAAALTWRAGLLYEFENGLAPYVSYSTSFEPLMGTGVGGTLFKPTTGQQYEAGIKYKPAGFDALFTVSAFHLTQQNVLTPGTVTDPGCSSNPCQVQTGEIRSRGVEVSAKATLAAGFNVVAAYTYVDATVTSSNVAGVQGKTPVGVPEHTASLWADYRIQSGPLSGFGFGAGVRYIGGSYGDQTNTAAMRVPGYVLVDAGISYDFAELGPAYRGWRASINATNLFDKHYVSACASANQCFYGLGRSVVGTLTFRW